MAISRNQFSGRKALVLGDDNRSFLSVIRSLGRAGVEVHVAWYERTPQEGSIATASRYVTKRHQLPEYHQKSEDWKLALAALMQHEKFDLVIPCSDPFLIPLQQHRDVFEPLGQIYLLDNLVYGTVFDKFKMNEMARANGVNTPNEALVTRYQDAGTVLAQMRLPVVLKPQCSFSEADVGMRHCVKKAYSRDEFYRLIGEYLVSGPVAVQENFIGQGVGVELLLLDGKALMTFQHVRLHEPLYGGGSSYRQGVEVDQRLLGAALALLSPLRYSGVAMVEFKVNEATGEWVFIEVNARFWGSLPLAIASGADFPLGLFAMLVEGKTDFATKYRKGLCCRNWTYDFYWQALNVKADHSDRTLCTMPLTSVFVETARNLLTLRERSDTLTLDDPRPGLAEISSLLALLLVGIRSRISRIYKHLPFIRKRAMLDAHRAAAKANTVLFVCKGNICRSPFAAVMASKMTTKSFSSAGYLGPDHRKSPDAAQRAAQRFGVDLSDHESVLLTDEIVNSADVIFVFDIQNREHLLQHYPCVKRRVHLLGALETDGPLAVADPWGGSTEDFEETYIRIHALLRSCFR